MSARDTAQWVWSDLCLHRTEACRLKLKAFVCKCVRCIEQRVEVWVTTASEANRWFRRRLFCRDGFPWDLWPTIFSPLFPLTDPRGVIRMTLTKMCCGLLTGRIWLTIKIAFFTWVEQGARFWMIIFSSSQKASNCIGWQAHTDWYAVMNGFYVKCMFAFLLHRICPITLTSAINLPLTSGYKIQHFNSFWSRQDSDEILKQHQEKKTAVFLCSKKLNCRFRIKNSALVECRHPKHHIKLLFFECYI